MAKGKSVKYKLISLESGKECGYLRVNPIDMDKTKKYMRFDLKMYFYIRSSNSEAFVQTRVSKI